MLESVGGLCGCSRTISNSAAGAEDPAWSVRGELWMARLGCQPTPGRVFGRFVTAFEVFGRMEVCIGGRALAALGLLLALAGSGDLVSLLLVGIDSVESVAGVRARFLGGCELSLALEDFNFFGASDSSSEGKSNISGAFTFLPASLDAFATVISSASFRKPRPFLSFTAREGARTRCVRGWELSLVLVDLA